MEENKNTEKHCDVSVVISTYNRCDMLPTALDSVLSQVTGGVSYEVIVVDNNSTDQTREVVERYLARGHSHLRYVFEGKQGISHGRNAGISQARGAIIAYTDDDVMVAPDWVCNLKRAFDEHPDVACVGGKILPRWQRDPPTWLTRDHWVGVLALQDYGEQPIFTDASTPISLATANLSFRREVFERIGLFAPEFSGKEDTQLLVRFWLSGGKSMYAPDVVVVADVQIERMEKAYHRNWHTKNGAYNSLMRLNEIIDASGRLTKTPPAEVTLFSTPAFMYRQLTSECALWLTENLRRRESKAFSHENRMRYYIAYIKKRYEQHGAQGGNSGLIEVYNFAKALLRKKALHSAKT